MPKLSKDDLLSIIEAHESSSLGGENGELANERSEALKRYFGDPYGDEVDGRSTVVSKDLADAVDWIMPSLMRVFLASDDYLRFDPVGPEDEQQAEQESDYTNHVIVKLNHGFILLYDWFKDALLQKNGYVKHWWDETDKVTHETYGELTSDQVVQLVQNLEAEGDKIEVVGQSVEKRKIDGQEYDIYEIKIRRTCTYGKVKIEPVPPEEIRVSKRTKRMKDSPFVQHFTKKTRSELIEMGMDKKFVDSLPAWDDEDLTGEKIERDQVADESDTSSEGTIDRSMDEIVYKENYIRVDWDDDGIAELRKITVVGNKIPDGEDWNEEIDDVPFSDLTPNRMPHRHVGRGLNDELEDIAQIKTVLWRQLLDNTYLLNNLEWLVNERVNLADFMTSRPGGIKRVKGMDPILDAAKPVDKQPILQHVLPVLDYMDTVKETRTGVGKNVMGLDAETLRKTTEGAARQALQQANAKIEMIARLFGETGVKDLALAVHALLIKHQNKMQRVKLRNNWVEVNPQEWKNRTDLTVNVGLGTGSQDEIRSNLMLMGTLQERAAAAGIVLPNNVYNLAEKMSDILGFKQKGMFFTDPKSPEYKQAQQGQNRSDPLVEAEKVKAAANAQVQEMREMMKKMKDDQELMFEKYKFDRQYALDMAKAEIEALVKGLKADLGQPGLGTETQQVPQ